DVYLHPAFYSNYYGIDVSVIESLACGTPVVSPTLKEFPIIERDKIGKIPKDENDVVKCVSEILENLSYYYDCRIIAKNIFSWKNIIENTIRIYDELFKKYYD
ncbi:MAG: glycosyltransferase, partial [Candidatus Helarchaeota archaeon]